MGTRLQLQSLLEVLLGSRKVYFQPPESVKIDYPCIIYRRTSGKTIFSNNKPYNHGLQYVITVVDRNPDSLIPGKVADLPMCVQATRYTKDNLNHDVFNIYY